MRDRWQRRGYKRKPRRRAPSRVRRNPLTLDQIPPEVMQVAARLRSGRPHVKTNLVGGAVIDLLQGKQPKDWDIEVFGLGMEQLTRMAQQMGKADEVGKSFGIVKLWLPSGLDLDLSIPRRENKVGAGHRDFETQLDPNMSVAEAGRRRDFTINSMALDLKTGQLIDPFGGLADLQAGVLRATDARTFVEDPLRALRGMQLLARKAKSVDPATMGLVRTIKGEFKHLPPDRVLEEWRKLLLKADRPSVGLQYLYDSGWIEHFPELLSLVGVVQHPDWHPEGDVWEHTKRVADAMAQVRHRVPEEVVMPGGKKVKAREAFAFGAMLHDVGKPATTITREMVKRGQAPAEKLFTAHGHDQAGRAPSKAFMERIGAAKDTSRLAEEIVGQHMQPYGLYSGKAGRAAYARLARAMEAAGGDLALLARMSQVDACGTGHGRRFGPTGDPDWEHLCSDPLFAYQTEFDADRSKVDPLVLGRDLIALGYKPGAHFSVLTSRALELQDEGFNKDSILTMLVNEFPEKAPRYVKKVKKNPPDPNAPWPYKTVKMGHVTWRVYKAGQNKFLLSPPSGDRGSPQPTIGVQFKIMSNRAILEREASEETMKLILLPSLRITRPEMDAALNGEERCERKVWREWYKFLDFASVELNRQMKRKS